MQHEHGNCADRRKHIWNAFNPILELIESSENHPAQKSISEVLDKFDSESIHYAWRKALERIKRRSRGRDNYF